MALPEFEPDNGRSEISKTRKMPRTDPQPARSGQVHRPNDEPLLPSPFIVGMPRSGTTLLRLMLDAHPELAIPLETHFLRALVKLPPEEAASREAFLGLIVEFQAASLS